MASEKYENASDKKRKASDSSIVGDNDSKTGRFTRTPEGVTVRKQTLFFLKILTILKMKIIATGMIQI